MSAGMSSAVSDDEKRQALARVLGSRTFSRSDQLRAFLRYVCEAELEGRAHQLNEYALGVSVLGRRDGYSPAEDSGVRSRAYELRNKLKSYYRDEAPEDPILIEIEKGAYVPRFQRREMGPRPGDDRAADDPSAPAPTEAIPPNLGASEPRRPVARASVVALTAALLLAAVGWFLFWQARTRSPAAVGLAPRAATPEMQALWRPFLDPSTPLQICFESRLFFHAPAADLVVRDSQINQVADLVRSKPLAAFQERMGAAQLVETRDYADVGAVQAAFLLGRLLPREIALKNATALGWEDLWNSNVIFLGKANANPTIRRVLGDAGLDFIETEHGSAVRNLRPRAGEATEYLQATTHGTGKKYGVITVLPGPQPNHHMMILTGSGAELLWALAQSVADPVQVAQMVTRVGGGARDLPASFQVLIEATFESNVPINIRYVTHHAYRAK
jgi:hypothetical protein